MMRRTINLFFVAVAVTLFGISTVFGGESHTYTDSRGVVWNFNYTYADNTATITGVNSTNAKTSYVRMPWTLKVGTEELIITGIADGAFEGCSNIDDILLPPTVATMTGQAFRNMGGVVYVIVPDILTGRVISGKYGTTDLKVNYYFTAQDIPLSSANFSKSQTVKGALSRLDFDPWSYATPFTGMVGELKFTKAVKAKNGGRSVKLSAVFTRRDGSKQRVKATLNLNGSNATTAPLKIHLKMDDSMEDDFYLSVANGKVALDGTNYKFAKAKIGGVLSSSISKLYLQDSPFWGVFSPNFFGAGWTVQEDLFGLPVITVLNGRKFSTPKGASFKFKKGKGGTYTITSKSGADNKSALKLTYNTKTGQIKGSLKVYVLNATNTKFKSYTVTLTGIMIGDFGNGAATTKKPKGGPWFFFLTTSFGVG
ncbi:MAG: hypothetical protein IKR48_04765 [Kiritimatiellae bacterium]|nr:hypothetical protein [Kiritimatiellia bacterium]